jgi:hypothetical protein
MIDLQCDIFILTSLAMVKIISCMSNNIFDLGTLVYSTTLREWAVIGLHFQMLTKLFKKSVQLFKLIKYLISSVTQFF